MFVEHFGISLEIDCLSLGVHVVHIVEEAWGATSATEDDILELSHLVKHVALYQTESFLPAFGENLGNGLTHTALDIPVEIIELQSHRLRQRLAYGGLSGSHIADEDYSSHFFFTGVDSTIFLHSS